MRLAGIYWRFKRDPARLTEILVALGSQAPSAQEFPTTATEALVQVTAWGEKLRELPGFMDMGGTYIRPHCMGKRLIAIASRLPPGTSWATVGLEKLQDTMADRSGSLSSREAKGRNYSNRSGLSGSDEMERVAICQVWLFPMWSCLWREPLKQPGGWGEEVVWDVLANRQADLVRVGEAYRSKHGLPACPYVLLWELLGKPPKRPRRASKQSSEGSDS